MMWKINEDLKNPKKRGTLLQVDSEIGSVNAKSSSPSSQQITNKPLTSKSSFDFHTNNTQKASPTGKLSLIVPQSETRTLSKSTLLSPGSTRKLINYKINVNLPKTLSK